MKWRKAEGSDGVVVEMVEVAGEFGKSNIQYWRSTRGDEGVRIH